MARAWLYWLIPCYTFCIAANCAPLSEPKITPLANRQEASEHSSCGLTGNPDFYGLGIRVGIYIQWITSFIANLFLKKAIEENLGTNTIFLLALFVATVVATVHASVQAIEIVVLLQLNFGFIFSILSIWGHRTRSPQGQDPIRFPLIPSLGRLALTTALSCYGLWFWFYGYAALYDRTGCPNYTFVFARVNASNGARMFFKIQSTLVLVVYGVLFAREVVMVLCFFCFIALWTPVLAST